MPRHRKPPHQGAVVVTSRTKPNTFHNPPKIVSAFINFVYCILIQFRCRILPARCWNYGESNAKVSRIVNCSINLKDDVFGISARYWNRSSFLPAGFWTNRNSRLFSSMKGRAEFISSNNTCNDYLLLSSSSFVEQVPSSTSVYSVAS